MEKQPRDRKASAKFAAWWLRWCSHFFHSARCVRRAKDPTTDQARGLRLLKENLSATQRQQYQKYGYFEVTGCDTGKRYRIRHGSRVNVDLLDRRGWRVASLCFVPEGGLVVGEVMLAQKLALELFESDAINVANRFVTNFSATSLRL